MKHTSDTLIRAALADDPELLWDYTLRCLKAGPTVEPEAYTPKLRTPSDISLAEVLSDDYLIRGWLDARSDSVLFGQWNAGKTFVGLHMGAHLALGLPWFGCRTRPSNVLYLAYEGHQSLPRRIQALRNQFPEVDKAPFAWFQMSHAITTDKGRKELEDARREFAFRHAAPPDLVIIDTLRAAAGGSDSDADLIEKLRTQTRLLIKSGCAVLLITHVGHGDKTRVRGDSGISAGADSEIRIDAGENGAPSKITATKQRDGLKGTLHFRLNVMELGRNSYGDPVTTCTVEPVGQLEVQKARDSQKDADAYRVLQFVRDGLAQNAVYTSTDLWRNHLTALGMTQRRLRDTIRALLQDGRLIEKPHPEAKGKRSKCLEAAPELELDTSKPIF